MKPLRCWFGRHDYETVYGRDRNEDVTCRICGKEAHSEITRNGAIFYVGRHHWAEVARKRGPRPKSQTIGLEGEYTIKEGALTPYGMALRERDELIVVMRSYMDACAKGGKENEQRILDAHHKLCKVLDKHPNPNYR